MRGILSRIAWGLFVASLFSGCTSIGLPTRADHVGSIAWVYANAEEFVRIGESDLALCQEERKRSCAPEEQALYQANIMLSASKWRKLMDAGLVK